jgi:hypothetical protein
MSSEHLMNRGAACGPGPGTDDAGASAESLNVRARKAIADAVRRTPAGQERNVLVAGLALRLAELGLATEVRLRVAGGDEAARAGVRGRFPKRA